MSLRNVIATVLASALVISAALATPAFAADERRGQAAIRGKDTRNSTIKLGNLTVRVVSDSVMRNAAGSRIALYEIPVPDFGRGGKDLMLGSVVGEFVAEPQGSGFVLRSLQLLDTTH